MHCLFGSKFRSYNSFIWSIDHLLETTTGNGTGYGAGLLNNVYKIQYSANYVFVTANSIPTYSIGAWLNNPNSAGAIGYIFKFPRSISAASTKTVVPMSHFGLWIDGVTMYNPKDGYSYNSLGVWNRNVHIHFKLIFK